MVNGLNIYTTAKWHVWENSFRTRKTTETNLGQNTLLVHIYIYERGSDKRVLRAFWQFLCNHILKTSKFQYFCMFLKETQIASNM